MAVQHIKSKNDPDLDRQIRAHTDALNGLLEAVLADAVLIEDVSVSTTEIELQHGLGRVPFGYIVVKRNADATVYEATTSATPAETINLTGSATAVVSLIVF